MRQLVGYLRYDTEVELAQLNQIWGLDRVYTNNLLAQQKLVAKVTKRYDRALNRPGFPGALPRSATLRGPLSVRTSTQSTRPPSSTRGRSPPRRSNDSHSPKRRVRLDGSTTPLHAEVLDEAMNQASRRI